MFIGSIYLFTEDYITPPLPTKTPPSTTKTDLLTPPLFADSTTPPDSEDFLTPPLPRTTPPMFGTAITTSIECASVYHGTCLDTYAHQCHGIAIPGLCGNVSHYR